MTETTTTKDTVTVSMAAYLAADRKGRGAIRAAIESRIATHRATVSARLMADDLSGAKSAMAVVTRTESMLSSYKSAAGSPVKSETDYVAVIANRVATLASLSDDVVGMIATLPDNHGVTVESVMRRIADGATTIDADLSTRVAGIALVRKSKSNDVKDLIVAAFIGHPVNTRLSVADVVRHAAKNGSVVSNGAVTARNKADEPTRCAAIVAVASDAKGPAGFRNKSVITDDMIG